MSIVDFHDFTRHFAVVTAAAAIAILSVYVALDLAARAHQSIDRLSSVLWICAGAAAMGSGVWSMHFVGMSAVDYPFQAGFEFSTTFLSWAMAVAVCTIPVGLASSPLRQDPIAAWACSCATGAGAVAMHVVGASAMAMSPSPGYDAWWMAAGLACATLGCGLGMSPRHRVNGDRSQLRAAMLVGGALTGMHFLVMAAASFAPGAICLSRDGIEAHALSRIVGAVTFVFLGMMLLVSSLEKRAQKISAALNRSLSLAKDEIMRVSLNDATTGLPNRLAFQQALTRAVLRADEGGTGFATLMIDIDDFPRVRRASSPGLADRALHAFGARLTAAVAPAGLVASAGAHQFLILAEPSGTAHSELALRLAASVAAELRPPFDTGEVKRLTGSIGIALYPGDGGADRVIGNAGVAMEVVKARGGNGYAFFEQGMDDDAHAATELLEELRLAIDRRQLALHYQPKVHAASGQIAGVEALLRWRHPARGMVSPAEFIPLAERFGLINEIGNWVLLEAVRQMAEWRGYGVRLRVAINVSPGQLLQPGFANGVIETLSRSGISAQLLTCEITETGAMQDPKMTMATFQRLETAGVQLSIDDFGTGYSSLSHLRRIPLRQLKVDRSFVADLHVSADARSIVAAIIDLAHALRLEVVAEGVETAEQRDILLEMGCDKFQGFLFARPMPAQQLTELMQGIDSVKQQFRDSIFVS